MQSINNEDIKATMLDILQQESKAILAIPITDAYAEAVGIILDRVHGHGGKLVSAGMGKAGQIAMNIATTFASTGTPAITLHPSEAQHGDLGVLQPNDVLLVVSNSGKTREILELIDLAHGLYPQLPIIAITGNCDSPVAHAANVTLCTAAAKEVCPLGLTPTTSTTMMTVMGDVLVVNTMKLAGFTREDYAKRHHGGYLGTKARTSEEK